MAYLGRKGAVAPLTSADIPAGIVEGTDIAFLENASGTQNLGGTYSTERMYLNDSYTLTGDVTITGHLALGTVADADVVITQDSTERTITGSGTLESGDLLHRGEDSTDLTGMTGELGSVVTGSPNLNLSNATFPTGHVINAKQWIDTSGDHTLSTNTETSQTDSVNGGQASFATTAGNTYLMQFQGDYYVASDGSNVGSRSGTIAMRYGTSAVAEGATSSLGDLVLEKTLGRDLIAASAVAAASTFHVNLMFMFTASSATTYYFNITGTPGTPRDQILRKSSTRPAYFTYYEFQGDVTA